MAARQLSTLALALTAEAHRIASHDLAQSLSLEGNPKVSASNASHIFGECECAFTSGNKDSCCADKFKAGMGTGDYCGSRVQEKRCGGDTPVCCTSKAGSQCCPSGSQCSYFCGGDGGGGGGRCHCLPPPKPSPASQQYRPAVAKAMASLAQSAYCGPDGYAARAARLLDWTCEEECAGSGFTLAPPHRRVIRADDGQDPASFAYLGTFKVTKQLWGDLAPKNKDCFVGYTGSMNDVNWKRNFQFGKKNTLKLENFTMLKDYKNTKRWHNRTMVHFGFHHIASILANEQEGHGPGVVEHLKDMGCGPGSGRRVFVTGQSLGAAVATASMVILHTLGFDVGQSYVFMSPRLGNHAFSRAFNKMFGDHVPMFRITSLRDPIARVGLKYHGFLHAGSEVYFYQDWPSKDAAEAYVICQDPESAQCSRRYSLMRTRKGYADHCISPLVKGGNMCAWMPFCDAENATTPAPSALLELSH